MRPAGYDDFAAFVAVRQRSLLRAATLLTAGDRHRAEDLVQDALVKLAVRWHVVGPGHPEAFVRKVMYRDAISWHRRHRRERSGEVPERSQADTTAASDERLALAGALARLTAKQRAVLVLRFYEDLTEHQTAEVLGVSVGTVKSQAHHALKRLREDAPELRLRHTETGHIETGRTERSET